MTRRIERIAGTVRRFGRFAGSGGAGREARLMSATGLDVFDKTLQSTHIWLDEIMAEIGPDRQVAWHTLGAVLRALRDRLPLGLAAHLGSQLPILVRGIYYDQWAPDEQPAKIRSLDDFLARVQAGLTGTRPVNATDATKAVFRAVNHHIDLGQSRKVREALPLDIRALWPAEAKVRSPAPAET
jgi:uncharacterized protein (DUF2267 family)